MGIKHFTFRSARRIQWVSEWVEFYKLGLIHASIAPNLIGPDTKIQVLFFSDHFDIQLLVILF